MTTEDNTILIQLCGEAKELAEHVDVLMRYMPNERNRLTDVSKLLHDIARRLDPGSQERAAELSEAHIVSAYKEG